MATWKWFYRELQGDEEISANSHASSPKLAAQSLASHLKQTYEGATLRTIRAQDDIFIVVLNVHSYINPLYIRARLAGFDAPWIPGDHNENLNSSFILNFEKEFS